MLHSNLYQVRVCIILLSFTLFFSVIYSVTFPLDNIMLHYSFASEACLRCLPLHCIILQSDLINYILLHYSLFTLHYSFVSEACLRCLPLHSDIPAALSGSSLRHPSAHLIRRSSVAGGMGWVKKSQVVFE